MPVSPEILPRHEILITRACYELLSTGEIGRGCFTRAAEAITAVTINAAHALGRANEIGSLEAGKEGARAIVLGSIVAKVIKSCRIVADKARAQVNSNVWQASRNNAA